MKVEYRGSIKVLIADEGKKITNSERSFFSDFIYLGKNDSPNNYKEVGREIWKHFIEDKSTDFDILCEKINNVDNKIEENNSSILLLEELLLDTHYKLICLQLNLEYGLE